MYKELLIGCGRDHSKRLSIGENTETWQNLTTLDYNPDHNPDLVWDLKDLPLPFETNDFDEIHAYEVLEHLHSQGDYISFFVEFTEYHRILKPGGHMFITVPAPTSPWAFGDPSHTRVMPIENFIFLSQAEYEKQVGQTPMSDFRYLYKADFEMVHAQQDESTSYIVLRAIK